MKRADLLTLAARCEGADELREVPVEMAPAIQSLIQRMRRDLVEEHRARLGLRVISAAALRARAEECGE